MKETNYKGIFEDFTKKKRLLYTKALTPQPFFNERIQDGFREFSPYHAKIAAAIMKHIKELPLKEDTTILYLGAGHGYTPSFLSDIITKGIIFCVDIAPVVVRKLLVVCKQRENMIPILANAAHPETYEKRIVPVDVIIQDVAQKNQAEIVHRNMQLLKPKGTVLISIKTRSIDVTKKPEFVMKGVTKELEQFLKIIDIKSLEPYEKDHYILLGKKK